ncbi:unnamed protein product [Mucor fragilis]
MLPLPLSVFITQIVALLGVAATTKLAILVAYYLKDLDIRLMYQENIFRHLEFYRDYSTTDARKGLVAWMSLLALLLSFIPTYLSFGADTKDTGHVAYTNIQTSSKIKYDLSMSTNDRDDQPLFTEFYDTSKHTPANSTGVLLENYIMSRNKETKMNPSGVWYNAPPAEEEKDWHATPYHTKSRAKVTFRVSYNNKDNTGGSSTLESCAGSNPLESNPVTNMTSIDGHQVQGARDMNRTCYPVTDPSLWLISFQEEDNDNGVDSLLNTHEDLYFRPVSLMPQTSASYSMGVVARHWNKANNYVVMVKKSAHITVFYSDFNRSLTPDGCNSSSYSNISTFDQNVNRIACELVSQAKQNPTFSILQATRRSYTESKMTNSVYTYIKKDNGHGIMIDLTMYSALIDSRTSAYTSIDSENFIAYQQVKKSEFVTTDFEQLLQSINPFPDLDTEYGLNTITDLVRIGVRMFGLADNESFLKTTARIVPFVQVSTVWIALAVSLVVLFILVITASTTLVPEAYRTDLRSLLIHTLLSHESSANRDDEHNGNTSLLTGAVCLETGKLLTMEGNPIILSENIAMADEGENSFA